MLLIVANILVGERDGFAGIRDGDDEIERRARERDIGARQSVEDQLVVAAGVENSIVTGAAPENVGVVIVESEQLIVARPAVENGVDADRVALAEAIDHVVARGFAEIDKMLQQALPRPDRAVAEIKLL